MYWFNYNKILMNLTAAKKIKSADSFFLIAPILTSFFTLIPTATDARTHLADPVLTKTIKPGQPIAIENSAHIPAPVLNVLRNCRIVVSVRRLEFFQVSCLAA